MENKEKQEQEVQEQNIPELENEDLEKVTGGVARIKAPNIDLRAPIRVPKHRRML